MYLPGLGSYWVQTCNSSVHCVTHHALYTVCRHTHTYFSLHAQWKVTDMQSVSLSVCTGLFGFADLWSALSNTLLFLSDAPSRPLSFPCLLLTFPPLAAGALSCSSHLLATWQIERERWIYWQTPKITRLDSTTACCVCVPVVRALL